MTKKPQNFRDKEYDKLVSHLIAYKEEVSKTPESAKRFLVELGVITEKGNRTKHYRHLCIPGERG